MTLPGTLATLTVTGTYDSAIGTAQGGVVIFAPSETVLDAAGKVVITATPIPVTLSGGSFSTVLPCTDNPGLVPLNWQYSANVAVPGAQRSFTFYLPQALGGTAGTVDITALASVPGVASASGTYYLPNATSAPSSGPSGGGGFLYSLNGILYWLPGNNVIVPVGPGATVQNGITPPAGDIGGSAVSPTVTSTHLTVPLPVSQGGAGAFSPMTYGAAGNGTTDDTVAVKEAFAAAAAAGGVVYLGTQTFLTSSPVPMASGITVRGAGQDGGKLLNVTSDLFTITGTVTNWTIRDCTLTAAAGHVFDCASGSSVSFVAIQNTQILQYGNSYAIWYGPSMQNYLDVLVGDGCFFNVASGATVAPWTVISTVNAVNTNTWRRLRVALNHSTAVPFFHIENQGAGGYCSDNVFSEITCEECDGGIITALSVTNLAIDNVAAYDTTTFSASLFNIGTGAGSNRSGYITIRNSGRRGGSLAGGAYDVQAASNVVSLILDNAGPESGTGTYSIPVSQTTVTGSGNTAVTAPGFSAAGVNAPAVGGAGARFAGATTSGHPTTGTWLTGDYIIDQGTPAVWICTAGGTPGTWAQA